MCNLVSGAWKVPSNHARTGENDDVEQCCIPCGRWTCGLFKFWHRIKAKHHPGSEGISMKMIKSPCEQALTRIPKLRKTHLCVFREPCYMSGDKKEGDLVNMSGDQASFWVHFSDVVMKRNGSENLYWNICPCLDSNNIFWTVIFILIGWIVQVNNLLHGEWNGILE